MKNLFPLFQLSYDLANAPEKEIFKYWEGLGYYSRCRNLIATAKIIAFEYGWPVSFFISMRFLHLPGIGPYTAAAIASFAFGLPYAVVDGNVERSNRQVFWNHEPVGSAPGKKELCRDSCRYLLDTKNPAVYNQAIMDFGATICKPQNPLCINCVRQKTATHFKKE